MPVSLNIKEAIEYFNKNRKEGVPIMTVSSLALKVFSNKKSKDECKRVLFCQIVNGRRRFVDLLWLDLIIKETGFPITNLITNRK